MDLSVLSQVAGIIMIVGSLYLIFKQKVYLDAKTKQPLYVELPKLGRLRTNAPILAVIVLGVIAVLYPLYLSHTTYIVVKGRVDSNNRPVEVYAVSSQSTSGDDAVVSIAVPKIASNDYQPHIVFHVGQAFADERVDLSTASHGVVQLDPVQMIDPTPTPALQPISDSKPSGFK